jgi:hypothetical protein
LLQPPQSKLRFPSAYHFSLSAAHRPASPSTPAFTKPHSRTAPSLLSQPVSPFSSTGASAAIDPPSSLSVAAAAEHSSKRLHAPLPPLTLSTPSALSNSLSSHSRTP